MGRWRALFSGLVFAGLTIGLGGCAPGYGRISGTAPLNEPTLTHADWTASERADLSEWHPRFEEQCFFFEDSSEYSENYTDTNNGIHDIDRDDSNDDEVDDFADADSSADLSAKMRIHRLLEFLKRDPTLAGPLVARARALGVPICIDDRDDSNDDEVDDFADADSSADLSTKMRIRRLLEFLERDPTLAGTLVARARALGVPTCIDDRSTGDFGYYNYTRGVVALNEGLTFYENAVVLVHELRHLDLVARGFAPSLDYGMKAATRLTLAAEADVQAVTALYAWRMKARGIPEVWAALLGFGRYADIAAVFEREMDAGGSEMDAARAAFAQWYASKWRTETYFRNTCLGYLERLDASERTPSYAPLPADYFGDLCTLPSGETYRCCLEEECSTLP